ncbi:MAG: hypothetical protein GX421_05185 [Caldisericales bacterium]|nr:hypothetical protein [Caldisericales bacterium]
MACHGKLKNMGKFRFVFVIFALCTTMLSCSSQDKTEKMLLESSQKNFQQALDKISVAVRDPEKGKLIVHFVTPTTMASREAMEYLDGLKPELEESGTKTVYVCSPEYEFLKIGNELSRQMSGLKPKNPVVFDMDYTIWAAFGAIKYGHTSLVVDGEIKNSEREFVGKTTLEKLLDNSFRSISKTASEIPLAPSKIVKCGYLDGRIGNCKGTEIERVYEFTDPRSYTEFTPYLEGKWYFGPEMAWHSDDRTGRLSVSFTGKEVCLFAKSQSGEPFSIQIWVDGSLPDKTSYGSNMKKGRVLVSDGKIYNILKNISPASHILTLEIQSKDCAIFSLEFR